MHTKVNRNTAGSDRDAILAGLLLDKARAAAEPLTPRSVALDDLQPGLLTITGLTTSALDLSPNTFLIVDADYEFHVQARTQEFFVVRDLDAVGWSVTAPFVVELRVEDGARVLFDPETEIFGYGPTMDAAAEDFKAAVRELFDRLSQHHDRLGPLPARVLESLRQRVRKA